jgi:glutathione synthase
MTKKLAIVMDPLTGIDPAHDTSFAIFLAAAKLNWQLFYICPESIYVSEQIVLATAQKIKVQDKPKDFFSVVETKTTALHEFDAVLMRKDPPFNMQYIYCTYFLELAAKQGACVLNNPQSIRDSNEKLFALQFPEFIPNTMVSSQKKTLKEFWQAQKTIILKPIDGMGGKGVFLLTPDAPNFNTVVETLTDNGRIPIMAQAYVPEIKTAGDRRILLINGQVVPQALARIPSSDDIRGNMAAGASWELSALTAQEEKICTKLGPILKQKGLFLVGLDVIGDKLTEINVTSPTGAQEISQGGEHDVAMLIMQSIEQEILACV